jgi:hypothetical protein
MLKLVGPISSVASAQVQIHTVESLQSIDEVERRGEMSGTRTDRACVLFHLHVRSVGRILRATFLLEGKSST